MSKETAEAGGASDFEKRMEEAKASLGKLPILGPVAWLCGRDPARRYVFMADIDWRFLPPLVLDQFKVYYKEGVPFGFITWARVPDIVHERLQSGQPRIAPHEWRGGTHLWLVDVIAPFGGAEELVAELSKSQFPTEELDYIFIEKSGAWSVRHVPGSKGP